MSRAHTGLLCALILLGVGVHRAAPAAPPASDAPAASGAPGARGTTETAPLDTTTADSAPPLELAQLEAAIEDRALRRIEVVLVEHHGAVVYHRAFGRSTTDTHIDARSAGKSITALAVGIAIDEGHLPGVQTEVWPLLESPPTTSATTATAQPPGRAQAVARARAEPPALARRRQSIRVEDLLTMTSALDCTDWRPSPGHEERMYRARSWTRFALDIPVDPDWERRSDGLGRFSYCTAGAFLLGRVVEQATGRPFEDYVQEKLFDPLQIQDPTWRRAPEGVVQSGGQLALRARDFAAIGRMVLNGGIHDDQRLVSLDWLRAMATHRRSPAPGHGYGYLWWMRQFQTPAAAHGGLYMSGNGGNKVVLFPELDAVVVILSSRYNKPDMHQQTTRMLEQHILPALEARESSAPDRHAGAPQP